MAPKKTTKRQSPLGDLPRLGPHALKEKYDELEEKYLAHLQAKGVWMPPFIGQDGNYHQTALALIGLYCRFGQPVTKPELTNFVRMYKDGADDLQDGRHLSKQHGWRVLSSHRGDIGTESFPKSSYALISLSECHPTFRKQQDTELTEVEWEAIQASFGGRCSLCGSVAGEPNLRSPTSITEIQRGHRDPFLPLTTANCLPQCQECNRTLRDRFIFDERGRPKAIALPRVILQSPEEIQREVLRILKAQFEN